MSRIKDDISRTGIRCLSERELEAASGGWVPALLVVGLCVDFLVGVVVGAAVAQNTKK